MRRRSRFLIAITVAVAGFAAGMPATSAGPTEAPAYVSLGDSLSTGYQPGEGETRRGYVDDLWRRFRGQFPTLTRQKFGCSGESSESLISGTGSPCEYAEGSQLAAAVAFLEANPGQVPFVTINIGSNDVVNACLDFDTGRFDRACVEALLPDLQSRVAEIVDALQAAAGPDVPIVGMTYYNPFLGFWVIPHGHRLARIAQRSWVIFNAALVDAYVGAGAAVAEVGGTFQVENFEDSATWFGEEVPRNVALACRWTWFCSDVYFGDPHANDIGYRKVGGTFFHVLEPLV